MCMQENGGQEGGQEFKLVNGQIKTGYPWSGNPWFGSPGLTKLGLAILSRAMTGLATPIWVPMVLSEYSRSG